MASHSPYALPRRTPPALSWSSLHPGQANPKNQSVTSLTFLIGTPSLHTWEKGSGFSVVVLEYLLLKDWGYRLAHSNYYLLWAGATSRASNFVPWSRARPEPPDGRARRERAGPAGSARRPGWRLRSGARAGNGRGRAERRAEAMLELHPERGAAGALLSWWV